MRRGVILFLVCLIFSLILIPLIASQTTIVTEQPKTEDKSIWSGFTSTLSSPLFWGILLIAFFVILMIIGVFFLIRWLIKYLKSKNDIFLKLLTHRIKLAKIQRRYPSKSWYRVQKNTPIRLVQKSNGKLNVSRAIAYHRGDYTTQEGNIIIAMNLDGMKKWLFYPITDLIVIPNKEQIEIRKKDEKGKPYSIFIKDLPLAKDIVQFNEDEILIFAESLSNIGLFYTPVIKAQDGKIIDLSLPVFQSLKEVALGEYLYDQTSSFVNVSKKTIDLNPNVRYINKTGDSSGTIEAGQGNQGGIS